MAFNLHFWHPGRHGGDAENDLEDDVMKLRIFAAFGAPALALGLVACTVEQDDDGEGIEVEPADVQVDWDTTQVRTPDIDIVPRDTMGGDTTRRDTLQR
jgi:hypothetical protein